MIQNVSKKTKKPKTWTKRSTPGLVSIDSGQNLGYVDRLTFSQRKVLCTEDVEPDCQEDKSIENQCCFPWIGHACVRIYKEDEALHHSCKLHATRRDASDPAETTTPPDDVAEWLLQ